MSWSYNIDGGAIFEDILLGAVEKLVRGYLLIGLIIGNSLPASIVDISNLSWKETDDFIIRLGIESRFDLGAIDIRSRVFRRVSYALTPNFDAMSKWRVPIKKATVNKISAF